MSRRLALTFAPLLLLAFIAPTLAADPPAPFANFDVIGTDPEGDAIWPVAPGVDDASNTFDKKRVDIHGVEAAVKEKKMQMRITLGTTPKGTASYMYAIQFKAGEVNYVACWTGTYVNNEFQPDAENTAGCSRFVGFTAVGPATIDAGVLIVEGTPSFILWEFGLGDIKSKIGDPITEIVATTWVRSPSPNAGGSTSGGSYSFNQADRAPDEESYAYLIAGSSGGDTGPLGISLVPADANGTTAPGGAATFSLAFIVNGTLGSNSTTLNFTAQGLPANAFLNTTSVNVTGNATVEIIIKTNKTLIVGSYPFTLTADAGAGRNATANLTLVISKEIKTTTPTSKTSAAGNTTAATGETQKDKGTPGIGVILGLGALMAVVVSVRRRRPQT